MRHLLPLLLSFLLLISCDKKEESATTPIPEVPKKEQLCRLVEYNVDGRDGKMRIKLNNFTKTVANVVTYKDDSLLYVEHFNSNHKNELYEQYTIDKELIGTARHTYEYSEASFWEAGNLWKWVSKVLTPYHKETTTYYEYDAANQLKQATTELANVHTAKAVYYYDDSLMNKIQIYDSYGDNTYTILLEYDDKKHYLAGDPNYQKVAPFIGNSHLAKSIVPRLLGLSSIYNITKLTVINNHLGVPMLDSYTATYVYNEFGYPIKEVRTYLDSKTTTIIYTYKCQ